MTIAHTGVSIAADKHAAAVKWYETALKPLGYKKFHTEGPNEEVTALSDTGHGADWWLLSVPEAPKNISHVAFLAKDRATVDAFHAAALEAGGKCNGPPGPRPYAPNYYAAFVFDPAGNNIEAVCFAPA